MTGQRPRSPFDLDGAVVLCVGSGSGIGAASAHALGMHGAIVVCADLDSDAVHETAALIESAGGQAVALTVDLLDGRAMTELVTSVVAAHGGIQAAVCTPSVNVRKPLLDYTDDDYDRVVSLNLRGTFNFLRATGRQMALAGGGSIVVLSSVRSVVVEPGQGVYAATKAGAVQLVRATACELGPQGVRANAVAPGVIDTPLTAPIKASPAWSDAYAAKTALGRWGRADEVSGAVVFLASEASSYVTGTVLFVDGGWTAIDGRFDPLSEAEET